MKYYTDEFEVKNSKPACLWSTELENFQDINQQIISTINTHKQTQTETFTDSINVNVWQSNWEMQQQAGIDTVAEASRNFTKTISEDYYNFKIFNPDIVDCWVNVYNNNSGCRIHQHFPATFSLVYYVQVPENSGEIFFPDLEINLMPKPGLLLCFRGDLWHGVKFNFTGKDRIVIGINIVHKHR